MTTLSYVEFPKNFSIKVSQDGNTWKEIFQIKETLPTFWSVFHPFLKVVKPRLEIDLSGDDFVQYCRIDIKATDKYPVKISELYVYERIGKHVTERELECDVDSLIHYIETLGKQWVIVADHWFVNYFKLQDYNVDFISNKFVNDSGKINPCFSVPNILDFQKKHLFILEKAQSSLFQKNMSRLKIPYTMKNFDFYTLFFVDKNTMTNDFYWDGLNIKRVFDPKKQRYKLCSPSLVDCFKNTAGKNEQEIIIANYVFEDCFSLSAYFLEYKQRKQKIMMAFEVNMLKNVQYGSYLFVHFCDQQGKILFQGDIKMQNFIGTTDKWMPGTRAVLDGEVNVPEGIKGEVTVKVGIWHPETGKKYKDISTGNSFVVLKKVSL